MHGVHTQYKYYFYSLAISLLDHQLSHILQEHYTESVRSFNSD